MRNILIENSFLNYQICIGETSLSVVILHPIPLLKSWCVKLKVEIGELSHNKIIHGYDALQALCLAIVACQKFVEKSTLDVYLKGLFPLSPYLTWDSRKYKKIENYFTQLEEECILAKSQREIRMKKNISKKYVSRYDKSRIIEIDLSRYEEVSEGIVGKITEPLPDDEGKWSTMITVLSRVKGSEIEITCADPISSFVLSYNELRMLLEEHLNMCGKNNFPIVEFYPKFLLYEPSETLANHYKIALNL